PDLKDSSGAASSPPDQSDPFAKYALDFDAEKPRYYYDTSLPMHRRMELLVLDLQKQIVCALEEQDEGGAGFKFDRWTRDDGQGYGISSIVQDSPVYEKGGVNISVIHGRLSPGQLKSMRARKAAGVLDEDGEYDFNVAGISLVIHPRNPMAPTAHANYRYFELFRHDDPERKPILSWFGGGADLTPSYLFDEDA
ncbi:hypothetical protein EV182_005294, partial [Spiromyces aspiralis]